MALWIATKIQRYFPTFTRSGWSFSCVPLLLWHNLLNQKKCQWHEYIFHKEKVCIPWQLVCSLVSDSFDILNPLCLIYFSCIFFFSLVSVFFFLWNLCFLFRFTKLYWMEIGNICFYSIVWRCCWDLVRFTDNPTNLIISSVGLALSNFEGRNPLSTAVVFESVDFQFRSDTIRWVGQLA